MDLTQVSLEDLQAYKAGNLSKVSLDGLKAISSSEASTKAVAPVDARGAKIDAYLADTDGLLGLTPGTSARQINQESRFNSQAYNEGSKAAGLAQMIPRTVRVLSNRAGRPLDPHNDDDALYMHREVMKENMMKFGNEQDAARAYNSGWDKSKWNNKETNGYVDILFPKAGVAQTGYQATPVRKDATLASLDTDPNWIAASKQLYNFKTGKTFVGTDAEASADGQSAMRWDSQNSMKFGYDAFKLLSSGTQDDHNAALYMMDQWETAGTTVPSFVKSVGVSLTDPMNIASLGTLGVATVGKIAAAKAAQTAFRQGLLKSLGRTGIQAGLLGGIQAGTQDLTKQSIEVSGKKKDAMDGGQFAYSAGIGVAAGVVVGTTADALLTAAAPTVQRAFGKVVESLGMGRKAPVVVPPTVVGNVPAEAPVSLVAAVRGYHGTKATAQEVPGASGLTKSADLGPHFTVSRDTANLFAEDGGTVGRVLEADLEIVRPLELPDLAGWDANNIANAIDNAGLTAAKGNDTDLGELGNSVYQAGVRAREAFWAAAPEGSQTPLGMSYKDVTPAMKKANSEATAAGHDAGKQVVKDWMTEKGYDGIKYQNMFEGKPVDTFIATHMGKVKDVPPEPHMPSTAARTDATDTAPITSSMTREELEAITTREQKGRKAVDDNVPDHPLDARSFLKLEIPDLVHGLRDTATNQVDLLEKATKVAEQLKLLSDKDLAATLEVAREAAWTGGQTKIMHMAGQVLHTDLKAEMLAIEKKIAASPNDPMMPQWLEKLAALDSRTIPAMLYDEAAGSFAGSLTRQRQTIFNELKGSSVESLMKEQGISRQDAQRLWEDIVVSGDKSMEAKLVVARSDLAIEKALDAGDMVGVFKIQQQRQVDLAALAEAMAPGGGSYFSLLAARSSDILHKMAGAVKETFISFVFSPTTVAINAAVPLVKTLTLPLIRYLVTNPLEKSSVVEMTAHYSALGSTLRGAFAAARASFAYEQSILTRDSGRMFEGEMVIPGKIGGTIRLLPRLLNASDEFLSHINYSGFVAGHAASTAAIEGAEKGLKGKQLNTFIKDAVEVAKTEMYEKADSELLRPIVNKGINKGLEGEALTAYVTKEAGKDGVLDALRHGANKDALDLVRDMLYKKQFSGDSGPSRAAQTIETFMNRHPAIAVITGQLFFRTPVRVFEEGMRMVPGVQFLAPNFMADLYGKNGVSRQVRAQGEALAGMAITGAVISLYASGKITGDGSYSNYRQARNRGDSAEAGQYTISSADGSTFNYKNLDPIGTPMKMIVNALERYDTLKIKEAQEFFVDQEAHKKIIAQLTVASGAITTAFSDANLVAGAKGLSDLIAGIMDPEAREDAMIKKVGSFMGMIVPNSLHKLMKANDPFLRDPATFAQIIQSRLGHDQVAVSDVKTAYSYDVLGQRRALADIGGLFNSFSVTTREERIRGNSVDHQTVLKEMDRLANETGLTFTAPKPTRTETGSLDLRTVMTMDGKETLYDRWQSNYRALNPETTLALIARSPAPSGTFKDNKQETMKGGLMGGVISELQTASFDQLLTEEKVRERYMRTTIQKAKAGAGLLDIGNRNK